MYVILAVCRSQPLADSLASWFEGRGDNPAWRAHDERQVTRER